MTVQMAYDLLLWLPIGLLVAVLMWFLAQIWRLR